MAMSSEPKAMLAYLGPIAPSMMNAKVEANKPIANRIGVLNNNSIEKAAIAKQMNVSVSALRRPVKLSSLSASAAAITPSIKGVMSVFCSKYQAGTTTPSKVINIKTL